MCLPRLETTKFLLFYRELARSLEIKSRQTKLSRARSGYKSTQKGIQRGTRSGISRKGNSTTFKRVYVIAGKERGKETRSSWYI